MSIDLIRVIEASREVQKAIEELGAVSRSQVYLAYMNPDGVLALACELKPGSMRTGSYVCALAKCLYQSPSKVSTSEELDTTLLADKFNLVKWSATAMRGVDDELGRHVLVLGGYHPDWCVPALRMIGVLLDLLDRADVEHLVTTNNDNLALLLAQFPAEHPGTV